MINPLDSRLHGAKAGTSNVYGRYRLIADVGRGGMANVYLAVTEGTDSALQFQKLVVMKMIKRELGDDPEFVRMFLNEARLAARLNHPNVIQTLEVGEAGGRHFLAMEYLEGQPLHRILRSSEARTKLGLSSRLHILVNALSGLHYAHELTGYDGTPLDIVHRDVSPANVFVTYDGHVKLMDFGIAKARDSNNETRVGVFKGKTAYIAPEQARGEIVDRRADIYSAGVMLWELMTGRRLWSGLTQTETLRRVLSGDVPKPSSVSPRVSRELERICMRALAFSKEDRYDTASELASELETFTARHFPPVNGRELGQVIAQIFTDDRERIREAIETQLARQTGPDAWIPELSFMSDTDRNSLQQGAVRPSGDSGETENTPRANSTLSREPVVRSTSAHMPAPESRRKGISGLWLAAFVLLLGGLGAAFFFRERRPAPAPVTAAAPAPVAPAVRERGVSDDEIKIGMSAVFSGPSRELGQNMKLGLETSFRAANDAGGVHGRKLSLTALDDGYEATRVTATMQELLMERGVFAVVGNVGTPTSVVAAPYAAQNKAIFFGAFTGAPVLRQDPPDRYVFNYRASYKEETAKSIKYLLEVRRLAPSEIVVFAQEDSYGDAGFEGVTKAMRALGHGQVETLRVGYKRNTVDVERAVQLLAGYNDKMTVAGRGSGEARVPEHRVKAVVMVATYRAAAKFIQRVRAVPRLKDVLFFNVSFVGSETLAEELEGISPALCPNVFVTQVVPPWDSGSTGVLHYREQLAKYEPQAQPGFVSLEGFIVGSIFVEALKRAGRELTTEKLVDTLERIEGLDLGFGTAITFGLSEHQGSHKVWGTKLDESCVYQTVDLE